MRKCEKGNEDEDKRFPNENISKISLSNNSLEENNIISHHNCINCLIKCTQFLLRVNIKHNENNINYYFKEDHNIFYYKNSTAQQIINLIKKNENLNQNLNKENIQFITGNKFNEKEDKLLNKTISFPIENSNNKNNKIIIWENPTILLSNNGNNNTSSFVLEIDLNNNLENKYFKEINQNFFSNQEIICHLNGIVHNKKLLTNEIIFSFETKNLIKSIQNRIEEYKNLFYISKKKGLNFDFKNHFFTPIFSKSNLAFSFYTYNKKEITNIDYLQTNFNSILNKKFVIDKLYIGINIPNYLANDNNNEKLNNESNLILSRHNSTKNQMNNILNESLEVFSNNVTNNLNNKNLSYIINQQNYLNNQYKKNEFVNFNNTSVKFYKQYPENNNYIKINSKRKNFRQCLYKNYKKYSYQKNNETIIINPIDVFTTFLFEKYKDKNNSLCNYLLFKHFIEIENEIKNDLTFEKILNSFSKINILNFNIPFINKKGEIQNITYSPTISNLFLLIKNSEIIDEFSKKLIVKSRKSSTSTKSSCDDNIYNENIISNIKMKIINSNELILEFNETKPPFLRKCLIEQLNYIINYFNIKNLNSSDIDLEKSYFSISWNSININLLNVNFLSFYYINLKFIGILPIKLEKEKWIKTISYTDCNFNKDYDIIFHNDMKKVEDFLLCINNHLNSYLNFSSDYEIYLKNKSLII